MKTYNWKLEIRNWKLYSVLLILSGFFTACHDDYNTGSRGVIKTEGEQTVTFILQLPGQVKGALTYAMEEEDENAIEELNILAFKKESSGEKFAYQAIPSKIEPVQGEITKKKVSVKLKAGTDSYRFVFLANVSNEVEQQLGDIAVGAIKEDVLNLLLHSRTTKWDAGDVFPMWGESILTVITGTDDNIDDVPMTRAIARIDVTTELKEEEFVIKEVYLHKYNQAGHVIPHPTNLADNETRSIKPTLPTDPKTVDDPAFFKTTTNGFIRTMYTYEVEANSNHFEKPCLVIGGSYKEGPVTYYRIDLVNEDGKDIHLLRNHWYNVKITEVLGSGYTDPDEAYEAAPVNVEVDVVEWDQGDLKDIVFDGQYILGVSESVFYIPAAATDTSVIITTDYPRGWKATFVDEDEWIKWESGVFSFPNEKDEMFFSLKANDSGAERISYIRVTAGRLTHVIKVIQTFDGIDDNDVNYIQGGEANCYILHPDGDGIRIPVSQANKDGVIRIGPNDVLDAELVWTDRPYALGNPLGVIRFAVVEGTGDQATLKVAGYGNPGNALVAVKVDGVIRWSWHIWVLDYDPEDEEKTFPSSNYGTHIWMDRNLGALSSEPGDPKSMGMVYQWGRKDPFPGVASFTTPTATKIYDKEGKETFIEYPSVVNSETNMINLSVQHPTYYYVGESANSNDWYAYSGHSSYLWRSASGTSTAYDPCPDGWTINYKVDIFWDSYEMKFVPYPNLYGSISEVLGYWSNSGYRNPDGSINIGEVSEFGYYWLGQPNSDILANAILFKMSATWNPVETGQGPDKGYGLSVRCVKK